MAIRQSIGKPMAALTRPQWANEAGMARMPVPKLPLIMCMSDWAKLVLSTELTLAFIVLTGLIWVATA